MGWEVEGEGVEAADVAKAVAAALPPRRACSMERGPSLPSLPIQQEGWLLHRRVKVFTNCETVCLAFQHTPFEKITNLHGLSACLWPPQVKASVGAKLFHRVARDALVAAPPGPTGAHTAPVLPPPAPPP